MSFNQIVVWQGTILGEDKIQEFVDWFKEEGFRIQFLEEVTTEPGQGGEGGRNDLFFKIHDNDIPKFAVWRLQFGMRWWEDVILNNSHLIYPQDIIDKYPYTWPESNTVNNLEYDEDEE